MHLSYLQAIVMGLIQGVTELFPVSSLGHSILVPAWLGGSWSSMVAQQHASNSPFLAFVVALHVATALALITLYWRDWVEILGGFGDVVRTRRIQTPRARLLTLVVFATVPVGLAGLVLEHPLRSMFARPLPAAIFLTLNGLVLFMAERLTRRARAVGPSRAEQSSEQGATHGGLRAAEFSSLGMGSAFLVGAAQILALFPGISRSGVTISAALLRRMSLTRATHFAFLLATPVILLAGLLKVPELFGPEGHGLAGQMIAGAIAAYAAAYIAARWLTRYLQTRTLYPFVIYCLIAGTASIIRFAH